MDCQDGVRYMSGWVRLDRSWHKTDCLKQNEPFCERAAWVWLISNAAWKDTFRHGPKGELIEVKRGQIHVSLSSLETAFNWSKKKVRGFINRLESGHMVGTERAQSGTLITICNYAKYQDIDDSEGHGRGTAKGTVGAQSGHTQEQGITNKQETKILSRAKKHRVPEDFSPEPFGAKSQSQKIIDSWHPEFFDGQLEKFRAHHTAKGTLHENWQSAWSTWVLNSRRFSQVTYGQEEVVVGI